MINTQPHSFYLYLIRHGESTLNITPDIIGQEPTTPLTLNGKQQAAKLKNKLIQKDITFDEVFSSNYTRAIDTAKIATGTQPLQFAELREYEAGDWKGQSRKQMVSPEVKFRMSSLNNSFQPPNGEALIQVERRASKWLEDTLIYSATFQQQALKSVLPPKVAVFSHAMTIKCLIRYIMNCDNSFCYKIDIGNTSVNTFQFSTEFGWKVLGINDTSHLD